MAAGLWDIPYPRDGAAVTPSMLLIPLVGFDAAGHRLGNGGGFYDRTLAMLAPRPIAIGVGYELGRLADIAPASHDQPMDVIVTEAGATQRQ
jgi:5-formyltetrahydrofolate cyclo-ligase